MVRSDDRREGSGRRPPWAPYNNGGFTLNGNAFTNNNAITNLSGINTIKAGLVWTGTATKTWNIANGSELVLSNTMTIEVNGDHSVMSGGTVRVKGTVNIGQATSANPSFVVL